MIEILILVIEAGFLIGLSAICSGLNISLMALDISDLRRKADAGDLRAKRVLPLRKNSHLSLSAILLSNVAVISATSLVLGDRVGGLIAGITSTLLIVVFGEIIPQALFVKNALRNTYNFAPILRILIFCTYPIAKPLQLLLDAFFGAHSEKLHTREELGMIIGDHIDHDMSELDEGEVEIIKGALQLSEKRVKQITTPLRDVFWLEPDSVIDGAMIDKIKEENFSRIPIINHEKTICHGILLMKDLVDIDFDSRSYSVQELPIHSTNPVGAMTALDTLFHKFIAAHSHLMPVERDGHIIGIVTIEDLIEEIIGREIIDESDH